MGLRGPKPTPTPILRLRGSWLAGTREGEPEPSPSIPEPPGWLSSEAREYWAEISQTLYGLNVMADVHSSALVLLVNKLAVWVRLAKEIQAAPSTVRGASGAMVANPVFGLESKAWNDVLKALREFGMTPSSLSAVRAVKQNEQPEGLSRFKLA